MLAFLETDRLLMRPLQFSDADAFLEMNQDPRVSRYLRHPLTTLEQTQEYLKRILGEYEQFGIGRYAVLHKQTDKLIGFSGLKYRATEENGYSRFYDIGYRFAAAYWGKGYATEAALAWLDYGFGQMKLETIYACAAKENEASQHLLLKIGFDLVNEYNVKDTPHYWYQKTKK